MALGRMSIQDLGVAPGAQKLIRIPGVSWITVTVICKISGDMVDRSNNFHWFPRLQEILASILSLLMVRCPPRLSVSLVHIES